MSGESPAVDFARIPRWTLVAYMVRLARRTEVVLPSLVELNSRDYCAAVRALNEQTTRSAEAGTSLRSRDSGKLHHVRTLLAGTRHVAPGRLAINAAESDHPEGGFRLVRDGEALALSYWTGQNRWPMPHIYEALAADHEYLRVRTKDGARAEAGCDPDSFGPLWPNGEPRVELRHFFGLS